MSNESEKRDQLIEHALERLKSELKDCSWLIGDVSIVYIKDAFRLSAFVQVPLPDKYKEKKKESPFSFSDPNKKLVGLKGDDPLKLVEQFIHEQNKEQSCTHQWTPLKDPDNGIVFPDGRGVCSLCGVYGYHVYPIDESSQHQVFSISSFGDKKLGSRVTKHCWPKEDCHLQGGDSGVVIAGKGKKNYATAFFEAFPTIDGLGVFIRGEGKDLVKAEDDCWAKYIKMRDCGDHQWERKVFDGEVSTTGRASCQKCDMEADALEPTTKCDVCGVATKECSEGRYLCLEHYYTEDEDVFIERKRAEGKFELFTERRPYTEAELVEEYIRFLIRKVNYRIYPEQHQKEGLSFSIAASVRQYEQFYNLIKAVLSKTTISSVSEMQGKDEKNAIYGLFQQYEMISKVERSIQNGNMTDE